MKTTFRLMSFIFLFFFVLPIFSGCSTAYKAARDERSMGAIIDDKNIEGKIKYRFLDSDVIKGFDISVYSFTGKVFLVGTVDSDQQKNLAVKIARGVEGVKSVTTYILNKKDSSLGKSFDDTVITGAVKTEMIKDKEMKSTQVEVKTIRGNVVLLGIVSSQKDIAKAVRFAKGVENVVSVKSFLMVK